MGVVHPWVGQKLLKSTILSVYSRLGGTDESGDAPPLSGARAWGWCATGASSYPLDVYKVAAVARDVLLSESARGGMTRC